MLGLADPMPTPPPRLDRAGPDMEVWEVGPEATANLAGSSVQRIHGALGGMPTAPDAAVAGEMVDLATRLAYTAPVLHDISDGGVAVALAEICIASGVGARVETSHPFNEDPHRFLVIAPPGDILVPGARRIGVIGGDSIELNGASLSLRDAADAWRHAIERALEPASAGD
jgi:phosphoribosylformylglycinamidine synthase